MKKLILLNILFLISFTGCNSIKQETGDLQLFLVKKLQNYSSRSINVTNRIIPNNLSWKHKTDSEGFGVHVEGDYFKDINKFIQELYVSESIVLDKDTMKVFRIDEDNIVIQCTFFIEDEKPYVSIVTINKQQIP